MNLTNLLLGGAISLLAFTLARLWILNGDMRAIRVELSGFNGSGGGLVEKVRELDHARGRHHVAIALLSGRVSEIDGKDDVEI